MEDLNLNAVVKKVDDGKYAVDVTFDGYNTTKNYECKNEQQAIDLFLGEFVAYVNDGLKERGSDNRVVVEDGDGFTLRVIHKDEEND